MTRRQRDWQLAVRQADPAADLSQQLTGGNGPFDPAGAVATLKGMGYVQHEYVATGVACSYKPVGELSGDGRWIFQSDVTASYRTRALVRLPVTASNFSGTVVMEWLNVSGGLDSDPDWVNLHEELTRHGDVWIGVSAQYIGVMGGPVLVPVPIPGDVAGAGLKAIDSARYGSLEHPGDGFSFDVFTQVARAVRNGAALDGMKPQRIIAAGESQSAFALVTYYNGVQPLTGAFDGFFVHSRGAAGLPLAPLDEAVGIANALSGTPTIFRTDEGAPVLDLQTESDVPGPFNSAGARQPDSDRFRLWEVAGTAHADAHVLGHIAASIDCGVQINDGPAHLVAKAAIRALDEWVRTGDPPPTAPRLQLTSGANPAIRRDADGIALGGLRTPPVDVPLDIHSGVPGPNPSPICLLLGSTKPLSDARIASLYESRTAYQQRFADSVDAAIAAGFVLAADRDALLALADPTRVRG
jgi:hypothetical protein